MSNCDDMTHFIAVTGGVGEWIKPSVLKTDDPYWGPRVRISPPPQRYLFPGKTQGLRAASYICGHWFKSNLGTMGNLVDSSYTQKNNERYSIEYLFLFNITSITVTVITIKKLFYKNIFLLMSPSQKIFYNRTFWERPLIKS